MATRQRKNSALRQMVLPFLFLLLIGYFVFHSLNGGYGAYALADMKLKVDVLEADLLALRQEREVQEHRIALFRRETLDPDMMDERARLYVNMAHPDEMVIFNN
ncbi:FtsB family cell division protein [Cohaesibacter gelatinilyticus]|jgi:cell division protein FtsB|uniref:Cell division protein FtsB n=1 Tax=Cohaesibacter gelatinilyticus TaxID=372072 RepID=A0A285NFP8_9HYPH|nr:septum formation initiator family protein [Cohaesibacter gelatinilyticus]SNZ07787.1 Cell division protein FtsB [Cohaesibacter gelatinilyticus]